MHCTLCNTLLDTLVDKYYYVCSHCGAYVKDSKYYLTAEQEKKRYEKHNNNVNDEGYKKFTSAITNYILDHQAFNQIGLDYGCGTGPVISKQLLEKGFQVKLYDPFFYPDLDYTLHQYDYIFCCEVFEHFFQPRDEVQKLLALLKPFGRLYVMTNILTEAIDFHKWYYRNDPTHVFIYTEKTINYIGDEFNLDIEKQTDRLIVYKKT